MKAAVQKNCILSNFKIHFRKRCIPFYETIISNMGPNPSHYWCLRSWGTGIKWKTFYFLKNGPILASFCLFTSFSHYNFNNWKKHSWWAWDSNPGPQDGRRRRNHGTLLCFCCIIFWTHQLTFLGRFGLHFLLLKSCMTRGYLSLCYANFASP